MRVGDMVKIAVVHPGARHPLYRGDIGIAMRICKVPIGTSILVFSSGGEIDWWEHDELEVISESR